MRDEESQLSIVSVIMVLGGMTMLLLVFVPALGSHGRSAHQMMNSANLRGLQQSMVVFGNSNNDYLPGIDSGGNLLSASPTTTGSTTATGAAFSGRLWVLLNGQYIGGDLLHNPEEYRSGFPEGPMTKWTSGAVAPANFSYAGLQIGDSASAMTTTHHQGRATEWKNNANSQAIMMSDRNIWPGNADNEAGSCWLQARGHLCLVVTHHSRGLWKGNLVWGDNHAEFQPTHKDFATRYSATTNTNDNLFATASAPGVTESSSVPDSNAMLIYF